LNNSLENVSTRNIRTNIIMNITIKERTVHQIVICSLTTFESHLFKSTTDLGLE